jgi:tetratricopeptide (TPR) repeat protein
MKIALYGGLDSDSPDLVATQLDLGKVSRDLNANEDARFYFKAALKGLYAIHGRDAKNSQLALCLTQLGGLAYCSGILDEAKEYFEKCLEMKLYLYGHDEYNDDIASTLNNLGSLNAKMKKHEEAFRYYEQALLQYTKINAKMADGVKDEEIKNHRARTLHNLGLLSYNLKQFEDAKKFFSESTKIKSEVFKDVDDSPDLALTLTKLSSVEARQGKPEVAKYYQDQAIKRSHTFLETHKSLINQSLLPPTVEEAAALLISCPNADDSEARKMLQDLEFWQAKLETGEATKSCWLKFPFKGRKTKRSKKSKVKQTGKK